MRGPEVPGRFNLALCNYLAYGASQLMCQSQHQELKCDTRQAGKTCSFASATWLVTGAKRGKAYREVCSESSHRHISTPLLSGGSCMVGLVTMTTPDSQLGPLDWLDWQLLCMCASFYFLSRDKPGMPSVWRYLWPHLCSRPALSSTPPFLLSFIFPFLLFRLMNTFGAPFGQAWEAMSLTVCYLDDITANPLETLTSLSCATEINWVFSPLDEDGEERRVMEKNKRDNEHRPNTEVKE